MSKFKASLPVQGRAASGLCPRDSAAYMPNSNTLWQQQVLVYR